MPGIQDPCLAELKNLLIFAVPKKWEHSSAGSEHLPYKQGVTGSNPVAPTKATEMVAFFIAYL